MFFLDQKINIYLFFLSYKGYLLRSKFKPASSSTPVLGSLLWGIDHEQDTRFETSGYSADDGAIARLKKRDPDYTPSNTPAETSLECTLPGKVQEDNLAERLQPGCEYMLVDTKCLLQLFEMAICPKWDSKLSAVTWSNFHGASTTASIK